MRELPRVKVRILVSGQLAPAARPGSSGRAPQTRTRLLAELAAVGDVVVTAQEADRLGALDPRFDTKIAIRDVGWMRWCDVYVLQVPHSEAGPAPFAAGGELSWAQQLGTPVLLLTTSAATGVYDWARTLRSLSDGFTVRLHDLEQALADPARLAASVVCLARETDAPGAEPAD